MSIRVLLNSKPHSSGRNHFTDMKMSQVESAIRTVLEFKEAFNRHDVASMMQLLSEDCSYESPYLAPAGTVYSGKEAIMQFWQDFFHKSPHAHIEIEQIFGLGMRCVMRWRYEWVDLAGKKEHVRGVDIFQMRNGLIGEEVSYMKGLSGGKY